MWLAEVCTQVMSLLSPSATPWRPPFLVEAYSHIKGRSMACAGVTQGGSVILTFLPFGCFHVLSRDLWVS